jgi:O-antigen ligase
VQQLIRPKLFLQQSAEEVFAASQPPMTERIERPRPAKRSLAAFTSPSSLAQSFRTASSGPDLISTLLAVYVFLLESRVLDLSPIAWMHIPMILLIILILLTLAKGNFRITFQSKISIVFALFTGWVAISVPFSKWRFASIGPFESQLQALVIFVIIVQAIRTPVTYRKITGAYAYAILVASLMSFYLGRSVENGRLALAGGTLGDPNELALVVGLPFWWDKANSATGIKKIFCLLCTIPIFISFMKTGSRSGLFTLLMLVLVTFVLASIGRKMLIAGGAAVLVLASMFLLPDYIKARYQTIFSPADVTSLTAKDAGHLNSDIASSEERKALLTQSIEMTLKNPIFGVGPGVFSYASWDERKAASGIGGIAQVTHNTYTQISSETGIPGFILFLAVMVMVLKSCFSGYRALRDTDPVFASSGRYLFSLLAAFSVGIFFLSVGYTHIVSTLFALTVALVNLQQKFAVQAPAAEKTLAPAATSSPVTSTKPLLPAAAAMRTHGPLPNSKAIRRAGLVSKRTTVESAAQKSS